MEEKKRFSVEPSDMPDYLRGLSDILYMLQGDKTIDAIPDESLFFLSASLNYFADDLETASDQAFKTNCELHQLKERMEVKTA